MQAKTEHEHRLTSQCFPSHTQKGKKMLSIPFVNTPTILREPCFVFWPTRLVTGSLEFPGTPTTKPMPHSSHETIQRLTRCHIHQISRPKATQNSHLLRHIFFVFPLLKLDCGKPRNPMAKLYIALTTTMIIEASKWTLCNALPPPMALLATYDPYTAHAKHSKHPQTNFKLP